MRPYCKFCGTDLDYYHQTSGTVHEMKQRKGALPRIHDRVEYLREVVVKRIILITGLDGGSNASLTRSQHTVSMSDLRWKVRMNIAPQDICIEIRIDVDIQRCFAGLKKMNGNLHFEWQE